MKPRPRFLHPNLLSYFRIFLGLLVPIFLSHTNGNIGDSTLDWSYGTALGLFIFGAFTDFWDGWMARRHHLESEYGRILDPTADKIFILGTLSVFTAKGIFSPWNLLVLFTREIVVTFSRIVWMKRGKAVGAEHAGKLKFCFQLAAAFSSFLYLALPKSSIFYLTQIIMLLAVMTTLYSGLSFFLHNKELLNDPSFHRAVASLGVGHVKGTPGTYGSLLGLILIVSVGRHVGIHLTVFLIFLVLAYLSIPRIGLASYEDPPEIVIDEVCGILLAFIGVPIHWMSLLLGFLLFRIFDVTKFFPLNWLEKRKGTNGIMLDDLGAGVYTWIILTILFR